MDQGGEKMEKFIWSPSIEVESNHGTREVSLYTHNVMKGNIFLTGEINEESANAFLVKIMYLKSESGAPINIFINSGGGEINSGLIIYDVIKSLGDRVNLYCTGMAASMAALIFSSGAKGRRFILPHSKTMIHEPLISNGVGGSATSIKDISDSILKTKQICNEILALNTGKSLEEINEITRHDHYMNAEESIEFGMCDSIITELP